MSPPSSPSARRLASLVLCGAAVPAVLWSVPQRPGMALGVALGVMAGQAALAWSAWRLQRRAMAAAISIAVEFGRGGRPATVLSQEALDREIRPLLEALETIRT